MFTTQSSWQLLSLGSLVKYFVSEGHLTGGFGNFGLTPLAVQRPGGKHLLSSLQRTHLTRNIVKFILSQHFNNYHGVFEFIESVPVVVSTHATVGSSDLGPGQHVDVVTIEGHHHLGVEVNVMLVAIPCYLEDVVCLHGIHLGLLLVRNKHEVIFPQLKGSLFAIIS